MCWRSLFCCFAGGSEEEKPLTPTSSQYEYGSVVPSPLSLSQDGDFHSAASGDPSPNTMPLAPPPTPLSTTGDYQDY